MHFFLFSPSSLNILPYCFLGLLVMAEGPVATLLGGAATSSGTLLPIPVFISVVTGNLLADLGWYGLGRFGKPEWLNWVGSKLGVDLKRSEELRSRIQHNAPRLLFLSKLTVGFPIPTLVATGLSRVPIRRWAWMWILGGVVEICSLGNHWLFLRPDNPAGLTDRQNHPWRNNRRAPPWLSHLVSLAKEKSKEWIIIPNKRGFFIQ